MSKIAEMAADTSHGGNALVRDTVTTANGELIVIPASWIGKFVEITVKGADAFLRFGTSGVQVDQTTVSSKDGSGNITHGGKEPHLTVFDGGSKHTRIDAQSTHFAHIGSAAGGKLRISLATGDSD